jgi:hypothetical protein
MTLQDAIEKYPDPKFTIWYLARFPRKAFNLTEISLFFAGFFLTVFKAERWIIGIPAGLFILVLVPSGAVHVTAWYLKRQVEKKRAEYLGITLQEYLNMVQ